MIINNNNNKRSVHRIVELKEKYLLANKRPNVFPAPIDEMIKPESSSFQFTSANRSGNIKKGTTNPEWEKNQKTSSSNNK